MADKFLRGAMILTMAGLMVKILGSVNRILLSRFLGGEGIGLYQMAYPVFLLMLSVSSAGIPIAISIIVSEKVAKGQFKAAEKVFKISLGLMVVTGICFAALGNFRPFPLLHPYVPAPMHSIEGLAIDFLYNLAIVCIVPAIFFISAYFGASSLRIHMIRPYFKSKWTRLGWPWLAGTILLAPELLYLASRSCGRRTPRSTGICGWTRPPHGCPSVRWT